MPRVEVRNVSKLHPLGGEEDAKSVDLKLAGLGTTPRLSIMSLSPTQMPS